MLLKDIKPFLRRRGILEKHRTQIYNNLKKQFINIEDFNQTSILVSIDKLLETIDYDEESDCFVDTDNEMILNYQLVRIVKSDIELNPERFTK